MFEMYKFILDTTYLYLLKWDLKTKTLIEVRVQCVFLHSRLLLLDSFSILLQDNLHIWILGPT